MKSPRRPAVPRAMRATDAPGLPGVLLAAIPAMIAIVVNRRAVMVGFTPDDLQLLEVARGIVSPPATLWRVIPRRLYFAATLPVFGSDPIGFHALSLVLHAGATVLVGAWARSLGVSRAAAFLAATLFGASALHRTVVWQASTAGESLALAFTIGASMMLARASRRAHAFGIVNHGLALLCKESVALAPLALLAGAARERGAALLRALVPPLVLSAILWAYILSARGQLGGVSGEAYAFGRGAHVFANFVTYARWSADLLRLAPTDSPAPFADVIAVLATLALGAYALLGRSSAARVGLGLWIVGLLPVLPLEHQVHEHYLYLPFAGFALAAGCALTALALRVVAGFVSRAGAASLAATVVVSAIALAQVAATEREFQQKWSTRIVGLGLPFDSMLRKMEMAANAQGDLAATLTGTAARLVILSPPGVSSTYSVRTGREVGRAREGAAQYNMLAAVLDDGRALRALFPQLQDVRLAEHLLPSDTGVVVAANRVDGHLRVFGRGPRAHVELANWWASLGLAEPARIHLEEAAELYPDSPELGAFRPQAGGR